MTTILPSEVRAYCRLSREDLKQPGTTEAKFQRQVEMCRRLAAEHHLTLLDEHIHTERASGTKLTTRPEALSILQDCTLERVKVLIAPYQDRLLRGDKGDENVLENALRAGKVTLITTEGVTHFDENYATGEALLFSIKAAVARHYVADLVKKRKEHDRERLRKNVRSRGTAPYGYKYLKATYDAHGNLVTPARYDVVPEQYAIVEEMFGRVLTESITALSEELTQRGVPAPRGGSVWSMATLIRILTNPFYAGYHSQRVKHDFDGSRIMLKPDQWILAEAEGDWPHPVTMEYLYEVRDAIRDRMTPTHGRTSPLAGILVCCKGRPMHRRSSRGYACNCRNHMESHPGRMVFGDRFESYARDVVTSVMDALPITALDAPQQKIDKGAIARQLVSAYRTLQERQESVTNFVRTMPELLPVMPNPADLHIALTRMSKERDDAQAEVRRLEGLKDMPDMGALKPVLQLWKVGGGEAFWASANEAEIRRVFRGVLHRIELDPVPPGRTYVRSCTVVLHSNLCELLPKTWKPPSLPRPGSKKK